MRSEYTPKWWASSVFNNFLFCIAPDGSGLCGLKNDSKFNMLKSGILFGHTISHQHTYILSYANKHSTVILSWSEKNLISLNFIQLTRDISRWRWKATHARRPKPLKSWRNAMQDIMLIACDFIWKLFRHRTSSKYIFSPGGSEARERERKTCLINCVCCVVYIADCKGKTNHSAVFTFCLRLFGFH